MVVSGGGCEGTANAAALAPNKLLSLSKNLLEDNVAATMPRVDN